MKKIRAFSNLFVLIAVVSGLITFSNCGGDGGDPDPVKTEVEKTRLTLTTSAWKIQSSTVDGTDQSGLFKNLTITFTTAGFTTVNGGAVWPSNGTWSFVDDTAKSFKRDDGIVVSIDSITETALTLSLTWTKTTFGGGRLLSISGKNVFVLGK
jgi:hypothetical protein